MAAFSNYLENLTLDYIFGGGSFTPPATLYVALFTSDAGLESGVITSEVSGNGYARVAVSPTTDMGAAASGSISNITELTFPEATGSWGTVTHGAVMDASTGGNVLAHGSLTTQKTISSGDTPKYSVGALTMTVD